MIREETELLRLLSRLGTEHRTGMGYFATRGLPEDAVVESLELTDLERAQFITLSVVPWHRRPSGEAKPELGKGGIWEVCKTIWTQHDWAYRPAALLDEGEAELVDFFARLEIMDDYDAHWWYTAAETLHETFDGDPRGLLEAHAHIAPHVARAVRRHELPGIADDVTTPFWLRLLHDHGFDVRGMRWVDLPVDPAVFRVTAALGDLDLDPTDRDDRALVSRFWTVFCRKHGLAPSDAARPLRVLGLHWDADGRDHVASVLADQRGE